LTYNESATGPTAAFPAATHPSCIGQPLELPGGFAMNRKIIAVAGLAIALGAAPLVVSAQDAPKAPERSAGVVVDDAVITAKVKSSLLADSGTKGLKIDVDTKSGVVQLKGNVASDSERTLAHNLAAKVEGVKSVENKLAVKP
jgi:hyperosmotically inducible periplasmic protein